MNNDASISAFLALGGFFAFIIFVLVIAMYMLSSVGLYMLATNQKINRPWIAWVPIANMYILGSLIKNLKIDSYEIPKIELVLPIGFLLTILFSCFPLIGWIVNIAYLVLYLLSVFKLYKMYRPNQAVVWLILSIILPFMVPIFIFIMRNDTTVA